MTHLSLFSGIGGLDLAAEMAGFTTVGQAERDDYCNGVLDYHWPEVPRWRDVKDVTAESFEERTGIKPGTLALLSGGFPCQPVSCAGKRKGDTDERWLWDEMLRVICEVRPRWVVAENVRGLLSAKSFRDGRHLFGGVLRDLAQNGYRVGWLCFGAGDVGAPHKRERVFIVAHSRCELSQGAEFGKADEVETGREMADQHKRSSKTRKTVMENPEGGGFGEQDICGKQQGGAEIVSASEGSRRVVAHAPRILLNRAGETGPAGRGEFADGGAGPTQPRLGDFADGLPSGLAGHRWPAGPGPQHPWEPPRIATGVKDRVNKLKALGNAVVPAQAYPVFRAIAEQMKLFEEATL